MIYGSSIWALIMGRKFIRTDETKIRNTYASYVQTVAGQQVMNLIIFNLLKLC